MYRVMYSRILLCAVLIFLSFSKTSSLERYEIECRKDILEASEKLLFSQLNMLEKQENKGGIINKYLSAVGLSPGYPYCAAGQYYCFYIAAMELLLDESEIPVYKTGLANLMYNKAVINGKRSAPIPEKHDLVIWRFPRSWKGHIERVIKTEEAGWIQTIGFNVTKYIDGRKREGVFKKRRNIYHPLGRMLVRGLIGFKTK